MLAWIPFLQPFPELVVGWYWLCIPLVIGVAMVYKESDKDKWRSTEAFAEDFILLAETASPRFSGRVLDDEELRAYVEYAKLLPDDKAVLG